MTTSKESSVKDRLKNIAGETGKDFNFLCIQYLQERFLARLSRSDYRNNFILKGALLLLVYRVPVARPSKDIDLLGSQTSNAPGDIKEAIQTIAEIELDDGVKFMPDDMNVDAIAGDAEYGGIRVRISATVGGDRYRLQLDIGFGDTIVEGPLDMNYPTLLDTEPPNIRVYSLESSLAEKWEAIVRFGIFGSRMKDFYDIWFLGENHTFENEKLRKAIHTTFQKRKTPIENSEFIFSGDFIKNPEKKQQWRAFLNRTSIELDLSFEEVVHEIQTLLRPVM